MGPMIMALICFGTFLRPTLEADSGPLILEKTPVTLRCKGHPGAIWYGLLKGESLSQNVTRAGMEADFHIPSMTKDITGSYHCRYRTQFGLSKPIEPLELVVTGIYDKPLMSVMPSQEVALGRNVTLPCQDQRRFDRFSFYKEGGASTSQLPNNVSQPDFLIPAVTAADGGIYRCYVFHSQHPYLWSRVSDPLELKVTAPDSVPSQVPGTSSPKPEPSDLLFGFSRLQAGILTGTSAFLILLFLFFFLFLLRCHHQHQARLRNGGKEAGVEETIRSCSQAEDAPQESPYAAVKNVQMDEHRKPNAPVEDPQEVTYAHLIHKTPSQNLEHLPAFPPGNSILYASLAIQ